MIRTKKQKPCNRTQMAQPKQNTLSYRALSLSPILTHFRPQEKNKTTRYRHYEYIGDERLVPRRRVQSHS